MVVSVKTTRFREDMAVRAGGMLTGTQVSALLGMILPIVDERRQRREFLGVPYETEIRYPFVQFQEGGPLENLGSVLCAMGDIHPWEQLMLLTTPLEGYGEAPVTIFQMLASRPDSGGVAQNRPTGFQLGCLSGKCPYAGSRRGTQFKPS